MRDLGGHDLRLLLDALRRSRRGDRPSVGDLRLHDQGLAAADAGPSGQPLGAADRRAVGAARGRARRRRRGPVGSRSRTTRPRPSCAARRRSGSCASSARRWIRRPCRPTSAARTRAERRRSRRSGASSSTSRNGSPEVAERVVTVSPDVASSTNLGGWINRVGIWNVGERIDWFADDTDTLVRWRESEPRPAHRARDRRGQPRRPARRARRDVVARRAAAAADRHALRPVRQPRAGAVVVRHVRRRAVDPRRHAVGRHARARGRRAPVDHHPVGRARAAALHRLGAGLRAGPRVGAARTRSRASAGPAAPSPTSASRRGRSTRRSPPCQRIRPRASSAAARRSPAATRCGAPRARPRSRSPPSARWCRRRSPPPTSWPVPASPPTSSASRRRT